jgi:sulfide:quinone oxidoreductase
MTEAAPAPSVRHVSSRSPKVLIAGGGVAALESMLALRALAEDRVEIEVLAPERAFVYRPLAVAEPFGLGRVRRFDVERVIRDAGCGYRADGIAELRADARRVVTGSGAELPYDTLILAYGASLRESLPGAVTFWGTADELPFRGLLHDIEHREVGSVAFAVGAWTPWPLPLYELALMSAALATRVGVEARMALVSHEAFPLEVFGAAASERIAGLLAARGVEFVGGVHVTAVEEGALRLAPERRLPADRAVAMPGVEGRRIPGVPADERGFIPVDERCRVLGIEDVYAAGDATSFPVKQGGIAAQQGDAVAAQVAAEAGAPVSPEPFHPVLRGLLLTGSEPTFMRAELRGGAGEASIAESSALWWPPGKIAGRHLGPHLAALTNGDLTLKPPRDGHEVEARLDHRADSSTASPGAEPG